MTGSLQFLDSLSAQQAEDALAFAAHHAALPRAGRSGVPGADYAWSKPSVSALKSAGEVFVAQYDSLDQAKNLTPARAHDLLAAGIKIVLVYEYGAQDMLKGRSGGELNAQHADNTARACHVPGIPVYFAADWDATPQQQGLIDDYLRGCATVIGLKRVGMYGGYWPLSRARAAGLATYFWGTPAWSGAMWSTSGFVPDIMQGAMATIGGVQCDLDAGLHENYGQYPLAATPPSPATWGDWISKGHSSLLDISKATGMGCSTILRATVIGPAPSMRAACSSRTGICRMIAAISQIPSGREPDA